MGIVVSNVSLKYLEKVTREEYPKKTAELIVRSICRALTSDERWVKIRSFNDAFEMAKKENITLPQGNFPDTVFKDGFRMKKENGWFYRFYKSETAVVRGWHSEAVQLIKSELAEYDDKVTDFVYTIGQRVVKTNSPYQDKFKKDK